MEFHRRMDYDAGDDVGHDVTVRQMAMRYSDLNNSVGFMTQINVFFFLVLIRESNVSAEHTPRPSMVIRYAF